MIDVDGIKREATGRWLVVFHNLGIDIPQPPGKHGPCPVCQGTDRFRVDKDAAQYGTWFCNQCEKQSGDGWALVQRVLGLTFIEAVQRVGEFVGGLDLITEEKQTDSDPRKWLNQIWKSSVDISATNDTGIYLMSRGIMLWPKAMVRHCDKCYNSDTKSDMQAMVAKFTDKYGKPVSIHRTYLQNGSKADVKTQKKITPAIGRMAGGAVRLFPYKETLGIAEGLETAMSCAQMFQVPTWAALSTSLMEGWIPPEDVKKIVIFSDNDSNFAGQKAAYRLANKLYNKPYEKIVSVEVPSLGDFNDELQHTIGGQ